MGFITTQELPALMPVIDGLTGVVSYKEQEVARELAWRNSSWYLKKIRDKVLKVGSILLVVSKLVNFFSSRG
jgi:hypothetical protein